MTAELTIEELLVKELAPLTRALAASGRTVRASPDASLWWSRRGSGWISSPITAQILRYLGPR